MSNDAQNSDSGSVDPNTVDAVFEVFRDRDRRYVLYFLLEHDRVSVQDIGNIVTGWVKANSSEMGHRADRNATLGELRHQHVPLLIESNLVKYDEATESLSVSPRFEAARPFIERACAAETGS